MSDRKLVPTFQSPPLPEEPWIRLPTDADFAGWGYDDQVKYNQMNRYQETHRVYRHSFDSIATNCVSGDYFEFGCHRARTFRIAMTESRRQNLSKMRFLAFDSFQGMPAPSENINVSAFKPGALCTTEEEFLGLVGTLGHSMDRVSTIKGFFQDSLNDITRDKLLAEGYCIAMATIDCDTYESYRPVLKFIEPFLQTGSIIYMRNLFVGHKGSPLHTSRRALTEFEKSSRFALEDFVSIGYSGKAFLAYEPNS
jgi:Macrocin-O-methyltransferase (TylF)